MVRLMRGVMVMVVLVGVASYRPLAAQDLPEARPAVLSFDIDLEKVGKLPALKDLIENAPPMQGPEGNPLKDALHIRGTFGAPHSMADVAGLRPDDALPFDFALQIRFANAEAAQKLFAQTEGEREEITEFGKTWYRPTEGAGAPPNLRFHIEDSNVEFGTVGYLSRSRDEMMSEELKQLASGMPAGAVRIVADFDGARDFVNEALAAARQQTPQEARAFLAPVEKIARVQLAMDPAGDQLLSLVITGVDESGATDIHDGLEALLGMAQMGGKAQVEEMKEAAPQTAAMLSSLLESLSSKRSGATVKLEIPKPEGFEAGIQEWMQLMQGAASQVNSMNRLRQVALAIHNYESAYNALPFGRQSEMSWRVALLPYMDHAHQFEQVNTDAPWNSPENREIAENMPEIFGASSEGHTDIRYVMPPKPVKRIADITDGMSNTIMLILAPSEVHWMQPEDVTTAEVEEILSNLPMSESLLVAFYDGSVRRLPASIDADTLRNLLDPADGNTVDLSEID